MQLMQSIQLVTGKGIAEDARFFGRVNRAGEASKRQISLIEREQLAEHAAVLGLKEIAPGQARANIETTGIKLQEFVGKQVQIGDAVLLFYIARTPCQKMDRICQGLRELMGNGRQGVMAQVIRSGTVRIGDAIVPLR